MNILLIFFALPIATILISIVLEKALKNPTLVAIFVFAVYLIVAFAAFDANFLIAAIIYTILAYITALLFRLICGLSSNNNNSSEESIIASILASNLLNSNSSGNVSTSIVNNMLAKTTSTNQNQIPSQNQNTNNCRCRRQC